MSDSRVNRLEGMGEISGTAGAGGSIESAGLVVSLPSDSDLWQALGEIDGVEFVPWDLDGPPPRPYLDIAVLPYYGANHLDLLKAGEIGLVQWQSIGYDRVTGRLAEGLVFANAASVHETATAELAVALALAAQRELPDYVRAMDERKWTTHYSPGLADRRVLLVGYGGIGKAVEARLSGFETARIERIARTARDDTDLAGATVRVRGMDELHDALAEADIAIVAVPLSDETGGLIDAAALAAMPDGALLVNVARGPVVDTAALIAELQAGRLRAALDVTDPEPLPEDHPLWSCPGLLVVPHVGGDTSALMPRMAALVRRQIDHVRAGERPENLVLGDWP